MLFGYAIAVLACAYLCYRHKAVFDRKLFLKSALFKSLAGSLAILLCAALIVNILGPSQAPFVFSIAADSLTSAESDTSASRLLNETPDYHYHLLQKLRTFEKYEPFRKSVRRHYQNFLADPDGDSRDIGHFGLGVFALIDNDYDLAIQNFEAIRDPDFPYVNFCRGDILLEKGDSEAAVKHFQRELRVANGNFAGALRSLVAHYEETEDFEALRHLLNSETEGMFPDHLARKTFLTSGDLSQYVFRLVRTVQHQVKFAGLLAAFAISVVWLIYLLKIDVFKRRRRGYLLAMFLSGTLAVLAVISFNDLFDLYSKWSRNGEGVNDFFYCFFMIGIPEEITKIFPLLILLLFVKKLREPLDYILFASSSALGFAFVENLMYFQEIGDGIIHGRAFLAVIGHMVDSSIVAFGFVIATFHHGNKKRKWLTVLMFFFAACLSHGIYDFLLYYEQPYLFFFFFILVIQVWVIMINNCLNNAPSFSYSLAGRADRSRMFVSLALSGLFALEYLIVGFHESKEQANLELLSNCSSAAFLIMFFSSTLSNFDLVRGYWRKVYFTNSPRRGDGSWQRRAWFVNWYFANAIKAHNYVGTRIRIFTVPGQALHNTVSALYGTIVNRIILYDGNDTDPHWFIVKLDSPMMEGVADQKYILIKLQFQDESLLEADHVRAFFRMIPHLDELRTIRSEKAAFPLLGFVNVCLVTTNEDQPVAVGSDADMEYNPALL
jgi:RsiW-degrading membrane proteinase PrsW (M82 family)